MKKIIIIALMAMFVGCAPKPEKVAQDLIKGYLQKTLDDPTTYEAVEFGQLDTIKHLWVDYAAGLQARVDRWEASIERGLKDVEYWENFARRNGTDESDFINRYKAAIQRERDSIAVYNDMLSKEAEWEEFKGLKMTHSFRSVTPLGKMLLKLEFKFDKALTAVESAELAE